MPLLSEEMGEKDQLLTKRVIGACRNAGYHRLMSGRSANCKIQRNGNK